MYQAHIALAESEPDIRGLIKVDLTGAGHIVDREATSVDEAQTLVEDLVSHRYHADILILGDIGNNAYNYNNARYVVDALRVGGIFDSELAIIRFSAKSYIEGWELGATRALSKPLGLARLPFVVAELLPPISGPPQHAQPA